MEVDHRQSEGYSALGLLGAALLGSALGVGVLAYVRSTRARPPPPPPIISIVPTASVATAPTPVAVAPRPVRFRVVPENAVLVVDGVQLAASSSVPRPTDGRTTTVLVRADGHQDTIVLVDGATSDLVEVSLLPNPKLRPIVPKTPASAKSADTPTTPPNPYD
jgi:hypothetical protein